MNALIKEATGRARYQQRRPVTLFTGQWADLPFEEVCRLASQWGYDGLEIACWGDHLDVARAAEDDRVPPRKEGHAGKARARLLGDLEPPQRASRLRGHHRRAVPEAWCSLASGATVTRREYAGGRLRR